VNPFFSLKNLLRAPAPPSQTKEGFTLPFNMTEGTLRRLQILVNTDEWDSFIEVLDELVKFNAEALLGAQRTDDVHFYRGVISGIRKAATITHEISLGEQALASDKRRREDARTDPNSRHRLSALFGSPAWRRPPDNL
jgi:hypothetical protein